MNQNIATQDIIADNIIVYLAPSNIDLQIRKSIPMIIDIYSIPPSISIHRIFESDFMPYLVINVKVLKIELNIEIVYEKT